MSTKKNKKIVFFLHMFLSSWLSIVRRYIIIISFWLMTAVSIPFKGNDKLEQRGAMRYFDTIAWGEKISWYIMIGAYSQTKLSFFFPKWVNFIRRVGAQLRFYVKRVLCSVKYMSWSRIFLQYTGATFCIQVLLFDKYGFIKFSSQNIFM